jgi:hypothetical protein
MYSVHVTHVALSNLYASAGDTQDILDRIVAIYGGNDWHYTEGKDIYIHHAVCGQNFNDGKAYVGTLCNSKFGFGISTQVQGNYKQDAVVLWGIFVVAHESGHSFGLHHTHDVLVYNVSCFISFRIPKFLSFQSAMTHVCLLL